MSNPSSYHRPVPPGVSRLRRLVYALRGQLYRSYYHIREEGKPREEVYLRPDPADYHELWDLFHAWLPLHAPPPEPPTISNEAEAQAALDLLLWRLEELFGPAAPEDAAESSWMAPAVLPDWTAEPLPTTPGKPDEGVEQMSPIARAIAWMTDRAKKTGKLPTNKEVLQVIPDTSKPTLYRDPAYKEARQAIKRILALSIPSGSKEHGSVEALDEDE